jgi:hypothetical protein
LSGASHEFDGNILDFDRIGSSFGLRVEGDCRDFLVSVFESGVFFGWTAVEIQRKRLGDRVGLSCLFVGVFLNVDFDWDFDKLEDSHFCWNFIEDRRCIIYVLNRFQESSYLF